MDGRRTAGYTLTVALCALGGTACALLPASEDPATPSPASSAVSTTSELAASSFPAQPSTALSGTPDSSVLASGPPAAPAEDGALAAYRGMWEAFVVAAETSDYDSAELGRYASGEVLRWLQTSLYEDSQAGLVTKGELNFDSQVQLDGATSSEVTVRDCLDTTGWLKHRADTGELETGQGGGQREVTAVLRGVQDAWSVAEIYVGPVGTC